MVTGRGVEKGDGDCPEARKVGLNDQVTDCEQLGFSSAGNLRNMVFYVKGQGDWNVYLTNCQLWKESYF